MMVFAPLSTGTPNIILPTPNDMKSLRLCFPLLLLLSMLALTGKAQPAFRKPLKDSPVYGNHYSDYHVGLKIGCPWNILTKSDIDPIYLGHFGGELGITAERSFQSFAVGLEFLWAQRGTKMLGQGTYQSSLHDFDTMRFETAIAYDVITLRVPLTWYMTPPASKTVTPYLFVAPGVEHSLKKRLNFPAESFKAFLKEPFTDPSITYTESIGDQTQTSPDEPWTPPFLNAYLLAGTGVMITIPSKVVSFHLKCDVGVNLGLLNLASNALKEQGVSIRSHGLEAGLTLMFDIHPPLRDACYYFGKKPLFSK